MVVMLLYVYVSTSQMFQSLLDFSVSVVLLLSTLTVKTTFYMRHSGILKYLECVVWNTYLPLWGLLVSSTWNLVALTFERYVFM